MKLSLFSCTLEARAQIFERPHMALFNESYRYADFLNDFALDISAFNSVETASPFVAPNASLFSFDSSFPVLTFEAPIGTYVMDGADLAETYPGSEVEVPGGTLDDDFAGLGFEFNDLPAKPSAIIEAMDNFVFVDTLQAPTEDMIVSLEDDILTDFDNTKILLDVAYQELQPIVFMADDGLAEIVTQDDPGYWDHAG